MSQCHRGQTLDFVWAVVWRFSAGASLGEVGECVSKSQLDLRFWGWEFPSCQQRVPDGH